MSDRTTPGDGLRDYVFEPRYSLGLDGTYPAECRVFTSRSDADAIREARNEATARFNDGLPLVAWSLRAYRRSGSILTSGPHGKPLAQWHAPPVAAHASCDEGGPDL